jgi:hypothetical protein
MTKTWTRLNNRTPNAISSLELLPLIVCHLVREHDMHKEKGPICIALLAWGIKAETKLELGTFCLCQCLSASTCNNYGSHTQTVEKGREWKGKHNEKVWGTQEWCTLHPQTEFSDTCSNRLVLSLFWCTCNFNAMVLTIVVVGWVLESNFMSWILGGGGGREFWSVGIEWVVSGFCVFKFWDIGELLIIQKRT